MEFVSGIRIDDIPQLTIKYQNLEPLKNALLKVFAKMIFEDGHIHCDAHPGNLLIRENPKNKKPQIVILDHGFYQNLDNDFRKKFCRMWVSMCLMDHKQLKSIADEMGITHCEYFPLVFLGNIINY